MARIRRGGPDHTKRVRENQSSFNHLESRILSRIGGKWIYFLHLAKEKYRGILAEFYNKNTVYMYIRFAMLSIR